MERRPGRGRPGLRLLSIRESAWVNVPPSEVWRLVLTLEEWPSWNHYLTSAQWRGKPGWKEGHRFQLTHRHSRRPFLGGGRISNVQPEQELRWLGHFLTLSVEFSLKVAPEGAGTLVSFSSQFQGLAARLASGDSTIRRLTLFQREFLASLREVSERVEGRLD